MVEIIVTRQRAYFVLSDTSQGASLFLMNDLRKQRVWHSAEKDGQDIDPLLRMIWF